MVQMADIKRVSDQVAREFHPARIVLFGSHADGTASADSDVDLLIIMPYQGPGARMAAEIANRVKPEIPVELLVRKPDELQQRLQANDFFLQEILSKGATLYAADDVGMDRQS